MLGKIGSTLLFTGILLAGVSVGDAAALANILPEPESVPIECHVGIGTCKNKSCVAPATCPAAPVNGNCNCN